MKGIILGALIFSVSTISAQLPAFDNQVPPPAPDYSNEESWSALPFRSDAADAIPRHEKWISDQLKKVDVFYVHPTMYLKGDVWNADVNDEKMNKKVDSKPVHFQATVFNKTARVYAPRYRQAIVKVFYEENEDGQKALDLAYSDVKRAFEYYLENHNEGRPIIIASHSQGTKHCVRLLKDFFDEKPLREKLVAAYVVGLTINENMYLELKMCEKATETGCYLSWMSYRNKYETDSKWINGTESVNPITWTRDTAWVDRKESLGSVSLNLNKRHKQATSAKIHKSRGEVLWVKTKAPWLGLLKNMHIIDYNLFWYDIRKNVKNRVDAYFEKDTND